MYNLRNRYLIDRIAQRERSSRRLDLACKIAGYSVTGLGMGAIAWALADLMFKLITR